MGAHQYIWQQSRDRFKVLWTLLILFLPVIGWLIWFFAGPHGNKA